MNVTMKSPPITEQDFLDFYAKTLKFSFIVLSELHFESHSSKKSIFVGPPTDLRGRKGRRRGKSSQGRPSSYSLDRGRQRAGEDP